MPPCCSGDHSLVEDCRAELAAGVRYDEAPPHPTLEVGIENLCAVPLRRFLVDGQVDPAVPGWKQVPGTGSERRQGEDRERRTTSAFPETGENPRRENARQITAQNCHAGGREFGFGRSCSFDA
jgi:hypothetical protein